LTDSIFATEEDLRSRLLLPFLQSVGVSPNQIKLERTLTLRLGRTVVTVGGEKRTGVHGRLDVLVMDEGGQNLFVVELKAESVGLTEDD
jgi:hypothetical protein